MEFAENNFEKSLDLWDSIVWSDEKMVRSNPKFKDSFVKMRNEEFLKITS